METSPDGQYVGPSHAATSAPPPPRPAHIDAALQALLSTGISGSVYGTGALRTNEDALGTKKFREGNRRIYVSPKVFEILSKAAKDLEQFEQAMTAEAEASGTGPPKGFDPFSVGQQPASDAEQPHQRPVNKARGKWGLAMINQICARDPKLPALPTLAVPGTGDADVDGDMALGDMGNVALGLHNPSVGSPITSPGRGGRARFASDAASPPPKSTRRGGGWMQALKTKRDSVAAAAEAQAAQPADTEAEDAPQQDEECTADAAQTEGDGAAEKDQNAGDELLNPDLNLLPPMPPPRKSAFNLPDLDLSRLNSGVLDNDNEEPEDPFAANPASSTRGKSTLREKPLYEDTDAALESARLEEEKRRKEQEQEELSHRDELARQLALLQKGESEEVVNKEQQRKPGVNFAEDLESVKSIPSKISAHRSTRKGSITHPHRKSPRGDADPSSRQGSFLSPTSVGSNSMAKRRAMLNLAESDEEEQDEETEDSNSNSNDISNSNSNAAPDHTVLVQPDETLEDETVFGALLSYSINGSSVDLAALREEMSSGRWPSAAAMEKLASVLPDPLAPGASDGTGSGSITARSGGAIRAGGAITAPPDDRIVYRIALPPDAVETTFTSTTAAAPPALAPSVGDATSQPAAPAANDGSLSARGPPMSARVAYKQIRRTQSVGVLGLYKGAYVGMMVGAEGHAEDGENIEGAERSHASARGANGRIRPKSAGRVLRNAYDLYASRPAMTYSEFKQLREWRPAGNTTKLVDDVYKWIPPTNDTTSPNPLVTRRSHSSLEFRTEWRGGGQAGGYFSPLKYEGTGPHTHTHGAVRTRPGSAGLLGQKPPAWRPTGLASALDPYAYLRYNSQHTHTSPPTSPPRVGRSSPGFGSMSGIHRDQWKPGGQGTGAFGPRLPSLSGVGPVRSTKNVTSPLFGPWREPGRPMYPQQDKTLDWGPYTPIKENMFARSNEVKPLAEPSRHVGPAKIDMSRLRRVSPPRSPQHASKAPAASLLYTDIYEEVEPVVLTAAAPHTNTQGTVTQNTNTAQSPRQGRALGLQQDQGAGLQAAVVTYRAATDMSVLGRALRLLWAFPSNAPHITHRPTTSHYLEIPLPAEASADSFGGLSTQPSHCSLTHTSPRALCLLTSPHSRAFSTALAGEASRTTAHSCASAPAAAMAARAAAATAGYVTKNKYQVRAAHRPRLMVLPRANHPSLLAAVTAKSRRHHTAATAHTFTSGPTPTSTSTDPVPAADAADSAAPGGGEDAPQLLALLARAALSADAPADAESDGAAAGSAAVSAELAVLSRALADAIDRSAYNLPIPGKITATSTAVTMTTMTTHQQDPSTQSSDTNGVTTSNENSPDGNGVRREQKSEGESVGESEGQCEHECEGESEGSCEGESERVVATPPAAHAERVLATPLRTVAAMAADAGLRALFGPHGHQGGRAADSLSASNGLLSPISPVVRADLDSSHLGSPQRAQVATHNNTRVFLDPLHSPPPIAPHTDHSTPASPTATAYACKSALARAKLPTVLKALGPSLQRAYKKKHLCAPLRAAASWDASAGEDDSDHQDTSTLHWLASEMSLPSLSNGSLGHVGGASMGSHRLGRFHTEGGGGGGGGRGGVGAGSQRAPACMPQHLLPIPFTSPDAQERVQQHMKNLPHLPRVLKLLESQPALAAFPRPWSHERQAKYLSDLLGPVLPEPIHDARVNSLCATSCLYRPGQSQRFRFESTQDLHSTESTSGAMSNDGPRVSQRHLLPIRTSAHLATFSRDWHGFSDGGSVDWQQRAEEPSPCAAATPEPEPAVVSPQAYPSPGARSVSFAAFAKEQMGSWTRSTAATAAAALARAEETLQAALLAQSHGSHGGAGPGELRSSVFQTVRTAAMVRDGQAVSAGDNKPPGKHPLGDAWLPRRQRQCA